MHVWAVRYIVRDIERSIAFYTKHLGFELEQQQGGAFARVSKDGLGLILSGPGSSGARALSDGRQPEPGGWNRLVLKVEDLPSVISTMKDAGLHLRSEIVSGPGGRQVQLDDPDGNPIELFEPGSH
jgi:glyoxylase I family protein